MLDDKKLYHYWMNSIKRAEKLQPKEAWKRAEDKLLVNDVNKQPYLSGYRLLYESLKSFLDQSAPQFDIQASKGFQDPLSQKYAECDGAMLDYIWDEQNIQKTQSRKLDSCLVRNIGFTLVGFDVKKWLPITRYLNTKDVFIDPDCDNQIDRASWIGYQETISFEEFVSRYNLTKDELYSVSKKAGCVLSEKDQQELPESADKNMFRTIRVFHIYAKGDSAIRNTEDDEIPKKSVVDELKISTPKRYLQYVEGIEKPLEDIDWPYDLDDNEFPITALSFNTVSESLYAYTDNDHMNRIDTLCDNVMSDLEESSRWAARKKFGGMASAAGLTSEIIQNYLNDPKKAYLPNIIDNNGNSKIKMVDTGNFDYSFMQTYQMLTKERKDASALGELLSTQASEYKDVTALAASIHDNNAHQRINRRLGGPEGYEKSITEDAVKILEIAHQEIPRYSVIEMEVIDEFTGEKDTELTPMPWPQAQQAIFQGNKLVKLGADAIVGQELAEFWRTSEEFSPITFKLSTVVRVRPGSTREATKEKKAAIMKQYFLEVIQPLLIQMNRLDLAIAYIKDMGYAAGIDNLEQYLPKTEEAQKIMGENEQVKQNEQNMMQQQQMQGQGESNADLQLPM